MLLRRQVNEERDEHIDMTPMVDLMCLLITFFMLTTAFSKPKVMVITMPEKNDSLHIKSGCFSQELLIFL